jgi:hypothetical protein
MMRMKINRSIISKGANATSLANPLYQECLIEAAPDGPATLASGLGVDAAVRAHLDPALARAFTTSASKHPVHSIHGFYNCFVLIIRV